MAAEQVAQIVDVGNWNSDDMSRLSVKFNDNIELTIRLLDADKANIANLLARKIKLKYVEDSAYLTDEDGTYIKMPDDFTESVIRTHYCRV